MNAVKSKTRDALPPAPRIAFRRSGIPLPLRAVLFCLIPHVWIGVGMVAVPLAGWALDTYGHATTGWVIRREVQHNKGTHYVLHYSYSTNGNWHLGHDNVEASVFDSLREGKTVQIRTLSVLGFARSRIGDSASHSSPSAWVCMVPFCLVWNGILFRMFHKWCIAPLREKRLVEQGDAAQGRVVSKSITEGRNSTRVLTYEYTRRGNSKALGTCAVSKKTFETVEVGAVLTVLYAPPPDLGNSIVYDFCDYGV